MSLTVSRRCQSGQLQFGHAFGISNVFGIGIAILNRGDDLVHIAPNKDEFAISLNDIRSAKKNRDCYIRDGMRYEPLPTLTD
jgi:hypothetical protein